MKPSERYRADVQALNEFREAYVSLVNATKPVQPMFITELHPNIPQDQWERLRLRVNVAAGTAIPAYQRWSGATLTMRNAAYVMQGVNPVVNWEMSLRDPHQMRPETVLGAIETAIGSAQQQADQAAAREHGVIGLVAAMLRWPSELRDAVGPGHRFQRRAAGAVGVFGLIMVTAVGTALAAGIVAGVVALWHAVLS